ncbi:hypothetical protein DPEC_G00349120 [Dallia pectoralis]|uniref:Uncharacterized protein n=1 Tax=Dallia pectoralis TaxID=75939 RepID=A0ACC2F1C3_DALPE|nr:hypothetical protein DPEC_G00349120 [Dallia pectoralis]
MFPFPLFNSSQRATTARVEITLSGFQPRDHSRCSTASPDTALRSSIRPSPICSRSRCRLKVRPLWWLLRPLPFTPTLYAVVHIKGVIEDQSETPGKTELDFTDSESGTLGFVARGLGCLASPALCIGTHQLKAIRSKKEILCPRNLMWTGLNSWS